MHKFLLDHECTTAQRAGWGGIKNGELLLRAEGKYDLFVNGITKRLPGVLAVDRVSFNLQRGSCCALMRRMLRKRIATAEG